MADVSFVDLLLSRLSASSELDADGHKDSDSEEVCSSDEPEDPPLPLASLADAATLQSSLSLVAS